MSPTGRYVHAWESYWGDTPGAPGAAIWDSDPSLAAEPHLELFAPYADRARPVVDIGCGNGTQTRYLARHFARAVGVDVAHAGIAHARRADTGRTVEFRQLDAADAGAVRELHERLGDSNVYMRAVIHQSDPPDRPLVAAAVAELVGERGRAFVAELTAGAKTVLRELMGEPGGPPPKLARVFAHGLRPAESDDGEVPELLRACGLTVLAYGRTTLPQTEFRADGTRIELPAQWLIVGRTG
ncbi:class I SAM-dependent methyltransferase [Streptomyces chryseus]|uniref:Methyltransferase n=1 Tax=Streptomyces chryseus TaxID=68186 RepID=A0ABQ3DK10_9ACTN|nr:class I SAM-dependent methyltransferase [Streptomyces chryseus]GHA99646.1 methyltransferase [Streptomyces chryseus]